MTMETCPEMITLRTAAKQTGLSYDALRKLCIAGKIVYIRIGTKYFINAGKLTEFLNSPGENVV